jgi:hypothetical protein
MQRPLLGLACALVLLAPASLPALEVVSLERPVAPDHTRVGDLLEWAISLDQTFADPFDPEVVSVQVTQVDPQGAWTTVDAFWFQDYRQEGGDLVPDGEPGFRARFRPLLPGQHTYSVHAVTPGGQATSPLQALEVEPAETPPQPFVRVVDGRFTDGYLPFGANVCWAASGDVDTLDPYFAAMQAQGLNWTRLWMTHFDGTALEWKAGEDGGAYCGVGCYNLKAAWRVDRVLQLAERHRLALQLVLQQHSQFEADNWSSWADNPWNVANGGPLEDSGEFFTDQEVVRAFDRKLAYLVARNSHSPALLAWEMWNEVDLILGADKDVVRAWQRARAQLLHNLDPYRHPVTTSYGVPGWPGTDQDWDFEGFDLIQAHTYLLDYWLSLDLIAKNLAGRGKPLILGEFGIDFLGKKNLNDTKGIHLHNASMLASLLGFTGGAMSWWWDSYLQPNDLWPVLGATAKVLQAAGAGRWKARLEAEVTGGDSLTGFAALLEPDQGFSADGALVWLHDTRSEWDHPDAALPEQAGVQVRLPSLPDCMVAALRAWDTWTAQEVLNDDWVQLVPQDTPLVEAPPFTRDLLIRLDCKYGEGLLENDIGEPTSWEPAVEPAETSGESSSDAASEAGSPDADQPAPSSSGCAVTSFRSR